MGIKKIYQTVEDRSNADFLESYGPIKCVRKDAWLGEGYYFWEEFVENAHLWGRIIHKNKYIVCIGNCNDEHIYDLTVSNIDNLKEFKQYYDIVRNIDPKKEYTVSQILEHMRSHVKTFDYFAVRADGVDSFTFNPLLKENRVKFHQAKKAYLNLTPQIQICIYNKEKVKLSNFKVIYPEIYCSEGAV